MLRVPKYRSSLVGPHREYLRRRRAEEPAVPVQHLFEEIKALGFTGCHNLLRKYISQGRADAERSHISPRRLTRMLLTRPDNLKAGHHDLLNQLTAVCAEMTYLATAVRTFTPLLKPQPENADALDHWITQIRAAGLRHLHAFTRGLDRDHDAVIAAVTLPYSNGPTEGTNTKPNGWPARYTDEQPSLCSATASSSNTPPSITTGCETEPLTGQTHSQI